MLELGHVRTFIAAATELHFGRAAKRLNMTQPPLSRQIQLLESELGVALFLRAKRTVQLTDAGRAFLPEARRLLLCSEQAAEVARQAASSGRGAITIGFVGASTYGFLPRLVSRARQELPGIDLTFRELSSTAQLEALSFERIDIGLVRPLPHRQDVRSVCVHSEALALALPTEHPLARLRRPLLQQLHEQAFIMYSKDGAYLHAILTELFRVAGIQPRFVQEMSQAHAILSLVSAGLGIAIVPDEARNACFDNVVFRSLKTASPVVAELHSIWRVENHNPSLPAVRNLIRNIQGV